MTTLKVKDHDFFRAVLLLDASIDALEAAAERERRREEGKPLRSITEQERAKVVRGFVREMVGRYNIDLGE